MRTIKFRTWDSKNEIFIYTELHHRLGDPLNVNVKYPTDTEVNWEQLAELVQGVTRKKFYAGDIVEFTVFDHNDSDIQHVGVVVNTGTRFMLWCSVESEFYGSDGGFDLDWVVAQDDGIRIIGNIHENPELLNV